MRAVLQRVSEASVTIDQKECRSIGEGLVVLLGVGTGDGEEDIQWLAKKIISLRIFEDVQGKMNRSVQDKEGEVLVVSQFTLFSSTKKGNRPYFSGGAAPREAKTLYLRFVEFIRRESNLIVQEGEFAASMKVRLCNDGPVTILLDSQQRI